MLSHATIFNEDVIAVRDQSVRREGDSFVFASTYMAQEKPASPETLKELVAISDKEKMPLAIGTDANAHHTVSGSTNVNSIKFGTTHVLRKCESIFLQCGQQTHFQS